MSKHFTPFECVLWCVLGLPWMDCRGINPLLASGAEAPWAAFSSIRKYFQSSFTPTTSCCLNQAQVFPSWHEFCLVTFWLLGLVFSILNLLNEWIWKLFLPFCFCFPVFGMLLLFPSTPASLPLLCCYKQHPSLFKMNMKVKSWHSLYHEIKSAANPVFQKSGCARGGS